MANVIFSNHVMNVFSSLNTDYESMNNLMQDLALRREIYDAETDRIITRAEANAKVLDFSRKILGINEKSTAKDIRRALQDHGEEWFRIIEDTVDRTIEIGLQNNDWFNDLVDAKTIGYHDRQDFYIPSDGYLSVAKAGTSHHDHILQRLGAGQVVSIPTELYVVKVGADINKYVTGQVDWNRLIDAITEAFVKEIQTEIFAEVATAASKLPVTGAEYIGSGTLAAGTKDQFDAIIANVSAANNGADVVVLGTKFGLSKISALADVQWGANAQKDSMMNSGNIGIYEGTKLVEIPNRFVGPKPTGAKVFNDKILMILPVIGEDGKFVKFVDEGDTLISEIMERDFKYVSDIQTYEVQRRFGVGTVIGRQFGQWTILP